MVRHYLYRYLSLPHSMMTNDSSDHHHDDQCSHSELLSQQLQHLKIFPSLESSSSSSSSFPPFEPSLTQPTFSDHHPHLLHHIHISTLIQTSSNKYLLINVGEGTQHILLKHKLPPNRIEVIIITQMKNTHVNGLCGLLSYILMKKTKSDDQHRNIPFLTVIGPTGLIHYIKTMFRITQTFYEKIPMIFIEIDQHGNRQFFETSQLKDKTLFIEPHLQHKENKLIENSILKYPINNKIHLYLFVNPTTMVWNNNRAQSSEKTVLNICIREVNSSGFDKQKLAHYGISNIKIKDLNENGSVELEDGRVITMDMVATHGMVTKQLVYTTIPMNTNVSCIQNHDKNTSDQDKSPTCFNPPQTSKTNICFIEAPNDQVVDTTDSPHVYPLQYYLAVTDIDTYEHKISF
ncbi:hypothetical protein C9374_003395 [Naegleria lovaniensis]|uniref:Uncharacterized protein n=1 Tax=Naegleria lovaniensis TaxID=51637 RepID=A0AA88GMU5_NAELO|nr:uncharacterized protein C9374_003395 [Naegleria lovaniensis]KAG2385580.1 hypothetical protein C9374_003395 [Naegleria lovaniensis]